MSKPSDHNFWNCLKVYNFVLLFIFFFLLQITDLQNIISFIVSKISHLWGFSVSVQTIFFIAFLANARCQSNVSNNGNWCAKTLQIIQDDQKCHSKFVIGHQILKCWASWIGWLTLQFSHQDFSSWTYLKPTLDILCII